MVITTIGNNPVSVPIHLTILNFQVVLMSSTNYDKLILYLYMMYIKLKKVRRSKLFCFKKLTRLYNVYIVC